MKLYVLLLFCFSTMACSSVKKKDMGFNRGALSQQISASEFVPTEISDQEIKQALTKTAQLPKHFRVAVYFKPSENNDWRWTGEDKHKIMMGLKDLQGTGIKAKVFPLLEALTDGKDLRSLRLAAAKHGADALLVIDGNATRREYGRGYAWSYALILPIFFVNGNESNSRFAVNATLWDVRNEFLYLSTETEGNHNVNHPLAFGESDRLSYKKSKDKALNQLQKNLVAMVNGH